MNHKETALLLGIISGVYQTVQISNVVIAIWEAVLQDYTYQDAERALVCYLSEPYEFPPKPGQIKALIDEAKRLPSEWMTPEEAWEKVLEAARCGRTENDLRGDFVEHPRILAAVRSTGWERIRMGDTTRDLPFARRDFIASFESSRSRDHKLQLHITPHERKLLDILGNKKTDLKVLTETGSRNGHEQNTTGTAVKRALPGVS